MVTPTDLQQQAEWAERRGDLEEAAELYRQAERTWLHQASQAGYFGAMMAPPAVAAAKACSAARARIMERIERG